ncbi:MAG: 4-hydroxy-tetrahydrodipicolinate synthase [Muribaculaceae bacterium]|nr:4-hydroxy-tetrahydrodipicolinate synthase [Muribaculaceae bacterium]
MGVAMITPFREDYSIDFDALGGVIDHIVGGEADFIVVLGTTAETPTLSDEEQRRVKEFAVERVRGRVPLVLGLGGNNTAALQRRLSQENLSGYSAILSVVPYYSKPTQEGIYRHYMAVAEASPLPVVMYNVPGRTGANMLASTVLRLAREQPKIIGIKEASGRPDQIREILEGRPEGFEVISGDDALTYPVMGIGASGVISVLGNAFPREFTRMVRLCRDGRREEARAIHDKFNEFYKLLFAEGNPGGIKSAMEALGLSKNVLRLPLVPVSSPTGLRIRQVVEDLKENLKSD